MRLDALSHVDLYCPSCRTFEREVSQHKLRLVPESTSGKYVVGGWLECSGCGKRYVIVDGVPCVVDGFQPRVEPAPVLDDLLAQYLDGHYGDTNARYWRKMDVGRETGLSLDVGCSVGRHTFECAQRGFAVGIDLNWDHLRAAAGFQRGGEVRYLRKARALRYEEVRSAFLPADDALFLLADIHNPPFKMETFDLISGLNLLDSVRHPLTALGQMDAMLKPGGRLFLSAPYVWDANVSKEWLETEAIAPHDFVKGLLAGREAVCDLDYSICRDETQIEWCLRKQDTQRFVYLVDAILAQKKR